MNPALFGALVFFYIVGGTISGAISAIANCEPTNVSWAKAIAWPYFFVRYVKRGLIRAIKDF